MNVIAMKHTLASALLLASLGLIGCQSQDEHQPPAADWQPVAFADAESLRFLPTATGTARMITVSEQSGLTLLDAEGKTLLQKPGRFEQLDVRANDNSIIVATQDKQQQQVLLMQINTATLQWETEHYLPQQNTAIEGLCLGVDNQGLLSVFTLGEQGTGEQWLVAHQHRLLPSAQLVRQLAIPPQAEFCQIDDQRQQLFINEAATGLWVYDARPESDTQREPVAMRNPFGTLQQGANAMALVPGGVLVLDQAAQTLHGFVRTADGWQPRFEQTLDGMAEPQEMAARVDAGRIALWVRDDSNDHQLMGNITWPFAEPAIAPELAVVLPTAQTAMVARAGDAADDPAIWINPTQPERSLVLGTNKQEGLLVYSLQGTLLQSLPIGRLNNVDVRGNLAVASHRDHNSLSVFDIDPSTLQLRHVGDIATPLQDIYGTCLYQPADDALYAFANDKDGTFVQYRITRKGDQLAGEAVRQFNVSSQPEGCVADDISATLFLGEEDTGIWVTSANPDGETTLLPVLQVGDVLHADVEGLALYHAVDQTWLIVSSQGNDSYVVLDSKPPFTVRGAFRIGINIELGIDGASETDGLEVTSVNLGGPYAQGMLVVQDGRKRLPDGTQNFKLVPWQPIADLLQLPANTAPATR